jgi:prepilin-type N-terminal cleavage/methylation domain-containing protein
MSAAITILRTRVRHGAEAGFTLIEILIVVAIIAILIAIAVPAYYGFSDRAEVSVAQSNVRAILPAVERFYSDNQSYVGLENPSGAATPGLAYYDPSVSAKVSVSAGPAPSQGSYCIYSTQGKATYFKHGPGGDITKDPGPDMTDCNAST